MKKILILLFATILLVNCRKQQEIDVEFITHKFKEYANNLEKLEYNIQRIDTFPDGFVWNNKGFALIEKDKSDTIFGFSFYGKRNDMPKDYLYDKGIAFKISKSDKTFETEKGAYGFLGSPGGQMIPKNIFHLDSVYKTISLIETEKNYILKYEYENDTVYNDTDIVKTVELSKDSFIPNKITRTSKALGNRTFTQTILSNLKINEQVENSIKKYKSELKSFEIIQPKKRQTNNLLGKELPKVILPSLLDNNKLINLSIDKLTLIDFWEVWCGPCIASFPKVESLKKNYLAELEVIGIVSGDFENAIKLIDKKEITFSNLVGNNDLIKQFNVFSFPRYFLVDKNGIVRKEYFEFSEQIEIDIKEYIEK